MRLSCEVIARELTRPGLFAVESLDYPLEPVCQCEMKAGRSS